LLAFFFLQALITTVQALAIFPTRSIPNLLVRYRLAYRAPNLLHRGPHRIRRADHLCKLHRFFAHSSFFPKSEHPVFFGEHSASLIHRFGVIRDALQGKNAHHVPISFKIIHIFTVFKVQKAKKSHKTGLQNNFVLPCSLHFSFTHSLFGSQVVW
jgi:hypothetical protein